MTNKKQLIAILSLTSILITSGFSLAPLAYSTGSNYGNNNGNDDDDDDDHSNQNLKGLCADPSNKIKNGCFEAPVLTSSNTNGKKWNIYNKTIASDLEWDVYWLAGEYPCLPQEYGFGSKGLLELQDGILGGPAQGDQHAELDSDCNGPFNNARNGEHSSVGINQTITTSAINDYQISFAYKARPDQSLTNNGLMVIWNDMDVTPDNIKFSKKNWKYASITVHGTDGQSKLAFEDTGVPSDSLGTFLDDVSVREIPKPTTKITLNKEFVGGSIPDGFELKINDSPVDSGEVNSFTDVEEFTITENAPNYVATFDEDCPFTAMGQTVHLDLGSVVECDILNTFVPPPTITVYHAVTQDNNGPFAPYADEFDLRADGTLIIEGSGQTVEVNAGEEFQITAADVDGYSFVLIAGDTKCPTILDELISLESGEHINCWVYHEDDFVEGQSGGDGVFFARSSIQMNIADLVFNEGNSLHGCSNVPDGIVRPCVTEDSDGFLLIVDPGFDENGGEFAAVVYTVQPDLGNTGFSQCSSIVGIGEHTFTGVTDPVRGFLLDCSAIDDAGNYNINYAIIKTTQVDTT